MKLDASGMRVYCRHRACGNCIAAHDTARTNECQVMSPSKDRENMELEEVSAFDFERFRAKLLSAMTEKGLNASALSRSAGLNPRAVKDIEERRIRNPRVSTVMSLERALDMAPGALLGISTSESEIDRSLLRLLGTLSQEDQKRIFDFLAILRNRTDG